MVGFLGGFVICILLSVLIGELGAENLAILSLKSMPIVVVSGAMWGWKNPFLGRMGKE